MKEETRIDSGNRLGCLKCAYPLRHDRYYILLIRHGLYRFFGIPLVQDFQSPVRSHRILSGRQVPPLWCLVGCGWGKGAAYRLCRLADERRHGLHLGAR